MKHCLGSGTVCLESFYVRLLNGPFASLNLPESGTIGWSYTIGKNIPRYRFQAFNLSQKFSSEFKLLCRLVPNLYIY
jgi:hypothetical protein